MERARVLDFELQKQVVPYMRDIVPLPGIYDPAFIAANQAERADNIIKGSKQEQMDTIRQHIRQFKQEQQVGSSNSLCVYCPCLGHSPSTEAGSQTLVSRLSNLKLI